MIYKNYKLYNRFALANKMQNIITSLNLQMYNIPDTNLLYRNEKNEESIIIDSPYLNLDQINNIYDSIFIDSSMFRYQHYMIIRKRFKLRENETDLSIISYIQAANNKPVSDLLLLSETLEVFENNNSW